MELVKKILGKELEQIKKGDLEYFFSVPREETALLEFKSGEAKINSIFKEICAFLNTEGGVLIIGTPKEKKVQTPGIRMKRVCQGQLAPSSFRDKIWLMGLITSNIVPAPNDIQIQEILTEEGNYFVIEVPQSNNPPHQFLTDGRYYIRMELEAKPAPHGIVEALFYKKKRAQLRSELHIQPAENGAETFNEIEVKILNTSDFPTDHLSYLIELYNIQDIQQNGMPIEGTISEKENSFEIKGTTHDVVVEDRHFSIQFRIMNKMQPFLITILAWNKEAGMSRNYGIFDPANFQFMETYKTGDQKEKKVDELLGRLSYYSNNLG